MDVVEVRGEEGVALEEAVLEVSQEGVAGKRSKQLHFLCVCTGEWTVNSRQLPL